MESRKLLFVDDEPMIVKIMKKRLEANKYVVETLQHGEKVVETARKCRPDAILLDIKMPDMDGYEVCRRLKADEKTSDIPVIMFSASQEDGFQEKAKEAGAIGVVNKPDVAEVLHWLRRLFLGEEPDEEMSA